MFVDDLQYPFANRGLIIQSWFAGLAATVPFAVQWSPWSPQTEPMAARETSHLIPNLPQTGYQTWNKWKLNQSYAKLRLSPLQHL